MSRPSSQKDRPYLDGTSFQKKRTEVPKYGLRKKASSK